MSDLYNSYDNFLIGRKRLSACFYGDTPGGINEKTALDCLHYMIEYLLKWDRETAVKQFDYYAIKKLKLEKIINYIDFPTNVKKGDTDYILSLLYPKNIRLSSKGMIEKTYKTVLEEGKQFPQEYFSGDEGFERFCICLKYLMLNYKVFSSLEEIYDFFTSPDGNRFLVRYRLKSPAYQLGIKITDAIHNITKNEPDSDTCYYYYKLLEIKDPVEYFSGEDGFVRFCCCFKHIIQKYLPPLSIENIYTFWESPSGIKLLERFNLSKVITECNIDLLKTIHILTKDDPDSKLYYCYFSFENKLNAIS